MTSIPKISACGSLILWAKLQTPVGPRSDREGEKCRPLDHMRQLTCINKAPFVPYAKINFYIYTKLLHIYFPCGIYIVSWSIVHLQFTLALFQNSLFQGSASFWSHIVWILARIGTRYSETLLKLDTDASSMTLPNQWATFESLQKETVLHTNKLLHTLLAQTAKLDILFKLVGNFVRQRGATHLSKV